MARTQVPARNILDHTLTGASFNPLLNYYDETYNYLIGDKVFWNNKLWQAIAAITSTIEGDLNNNPELSGDWAQVLKTSCRFYPLSYQSFAASPIVVDFNKVALSHTNVTLASKIITILEAGVYIISLNMTFHHTNNSRTVANSYLELSTDSGATWNIIVNSEIFSYIRMQADDQSTSTLTIPVDLGANAKIRVMTKAHDFATIRTLPNGCNISIIGID